MPSLRGAVRVFALALLIVLLSLPRSSAASLAPPTAPALQVAANCGDGWQTAASRVVGFSGAALNDIAALAPDNIWAVGYQTAINHQDRQPLIQHWDGQGWAYVPIEPINNGVLYAVAASGPNDVWAAGAIVDSAFNGLEGLILHWNGITWSRVPAPSGALMVRELDAVAPDTIWGVGYSTTQIQILRWKNAQSSPVPSPSFGAQDFDPRGIAAVSDSDVWLIGSGSVRTAHWNGTQWSAIATPDSDMFLDAVAASGSNDVWAVGSRLYQPYIMRWNGSQWLPAKVPQLEILDNMLLGVAALGPNDVWAVGRSSDAAIALHWDGTAWHNASPPRSPLGNEQFRAVAALSTTNVWPVGQLYLGSDQGKTLVKRYISTVALGGATITRSGASGTATISVALSSTVPQTATVAYATSNETAIAGTDYVATSGVLKIPPCQRGATFSVSLLDNPVWKPSAIVKLTISNPVGTTLATPAIMRLNIANYAKAPPGRLAYLPGIAHAVAQMNQGRIAYVGVLGAANPPNWDIWTMQPDGGDRRQLTSHPARDFYPAWSADGLRIAFVSERDGNPEVYVMNADGSQQVRLTNNAAIDTMPTWSPDGQSIAFISNRNDQQLLYIMRADGSQPIRITKPATSVDAKDSAPDWSPDGQRIAFASERDGASEIYAINPDGNQLQRLTNNGYPDVDPAWSPDGQMLAFTATIPGYQNIATMRPDGSQLRLLNQNFDTGVSPTWSPDGARIAFSGGYSEGISVLTVVGGQPTQLPRSTATEFDPDWQPQP